MGLQMEAFPTMTERSLILGRASERLARLKGGATENGPQAALMSREPSPSPCSPVQESASGLSPAVPSPL